MYAAASGKSNLGIPKKVGAEFVAADKPGKLPARVKPAGKTYPPLSTLKPPTMMK
jgi:hypothetical protein